MRKICLLVLTVAWLSPAQSQQYNIDSLNDVLQKTNSDTTRVMTLGHLTRLYLNGNTDTAMQIGQRGIIMARKINFIRGEAYCMARVGQAYTLFGNDAKAMDNFLQALKKAESINDLTVVAHCYSGLAGTYVNQGDFRKALYYDLKSLELAKSVAGKVHCNNNVGDDYEKLNQLDSAKYYTNLAFDQALQLNDPEMQANAVNNLGNIFYKLHQYEVAMANYRLSLSYLPPQTNHLMMCESTLGLARLFMLQNQEDSALYYAKKSFYTAKGNGSGYLELQAANFLADYYRKKKMVDSAYTYLSYVIASKDSLYSQEKTNQIKNLSFDETMREQEAEINKSLAQKERNTNIQFAIIGVTLVSFIIIFFLISQSIIVNERWVRFLGVLALLLVFEFINLLSHPWLEVITNHSPALMLLVMVGIASMLIPLHHRMEHWITHKMVTKNKKLRLSMARKIVARLEADEKTENTK